MISKIKTLFFSLLVRGRMARETVVDVAVGSPDHTTLVAALTAAGLVDVLLGEGPSRSLLRLMQRLLRPQGLPNTLNLNGSSTCRIS
jgi:hypothetical protein